MRADYDDLWGSEDEGAGGKKGGRGGGGKGGGSSKRSGGGGGGGNEGDEGDEGALHEDEVPEDIYKGEVDELRPQAPDEVRGARPCFYGGRGGEGCVITCAVPCCSLW